MNRKEGTRSTAKRSSKDQKHVRGREMTPALISALDHPIRREMLRLLSKQRTRMSPMEMTAFINLEVSNISYHARALLHLHITWLADAQPVRGSTQHFYASAVAKNELVAAILRNTEKDDSFLRTQPKRREKANFD